MKYWTFFGRGLRARWVRVRNRVLASPRFQHLAARCPLTRPIARARARGLFDLVAGFTYSQILAACVETGLLALLAEGALGAAAIAARIDLPAAATLRLLRAAAALDLVEPVGAQWALGSAGAALQGNRGIAEMIAHHGLLYADLADPVALLRRGGGGGALAGLWTYAGGGDGSGSGARGGAAVDAYSALMAASQPLVAAQVIDAYRFARHRRLIDIGGGEGAFVRAVGARVAGLELVVFDLPAVVARARVALAGAGAESSGVGERITLVGGDFLVDPLPTGCDVVTLVRVLHDHDDAPAARLLARIRAVLPPGGRLVIAEPMARTRGAARMGDAYFGLYLLAMGAGRPRGADEIVAMARAAGFARAWPVATAMPLTASIVVAQV